MTPVLELYAVSTTNFCSVGSVASLTEYVLLVSIAAMSPTIKFVVGVVSVTLLVPGATVVAVA